MSDFYGALQVPAPTNAAPTTTAAGDPFLDTLVSFLKAAINADLKTLWADIHPAAVSPDAEPLPIGFTFTHDPDEASFSDNQLPALYAWRADEPRHVPWTADWARAVSNVQLLWIPPSAQDETRRIRHPFRNAYAKALHKNLYLGRNTAWIVSGDTEAKAALYGSLFITHAQVTKYALGPVQSHVLKIEPYEGHGGDEYECILATLEVTETLRTAYDAVAALADIRGDIDVGGDEDAEGGKVVASYQFMPTLSNVSPATGTTAGGTAVTLTGKQFYLDEDDEGLTVTTNDATPLDLTDVVLVDECTITAMMPAHAAGVVGLIVTVPSGATATLASCFTYS